MHPLSCSVDPTTNSEATNLEFLRTNQFQFFYYLLFFRQKNLSEWFKNLGKFMMPSFGDQEIL